MGLNSLATVYRFGLKRCMRMFRVSPPREILSKLKWQVNDWLLEVPDLMNLFRNCCNSQSTDKFNLWVWKAWIVFYRLVVKRVLRISPFGEVRSREVMRRLKDWLHASPDLVYHFWNSCGIPLQNIDTQNLCVLCSAMDYESESPGFYP